MSMNSRKKKYRETRNHRSSTESILLFFLSTESVKTEKTNYFNIFIDKLEKYAEKEKHQEVQQARKSIINH